MTDSRNHADSLERRSISPRTILTTVAVAVLVVAGLGILLDPGDPPQPTASAATTSAAPATTTPVSTNPPTTGTVTTLTQGPTSTTVTTSTTLPRIELIVGHRIAFQPFQSRNDDGQLVGFEVDLLDAIAERIGAELTWVETSFSDLVDDLGAGLFDLGVGSVVITESSEGRVDFTVPYFNRQHALIVSEDAENQAASYDDLVAGDTVGALTWRSAEWAIDTFSPRGVEIIEFDNHSADALDALRSGDIRGLISMIVYPLVASEGLASFIVADTAPTGEHIAFGIDPGNDELRVTVDNALVGLIEDGTYQAIYDAWFTDRAGSVDRG